MSFSKYSSIPEFYNGKSVFITGSTGFLGKVIVEKLLRSCEGIENVYLLVRPKKGKQASDRLGAFIKSPAFDLIKEKDPKILDKIVLIEGDITSIELGISKADQEILCEKVSVIINSAATINFDEILRVAVYTNLRSLRELIRLSRKMKHLEVKAIMKFCMEGQVCRLFFYSLSSTFRLPIPTGSNMMLRKNFIRLNAILMQ